jgi:hypothetical protein
MKYKTQNTKIIHFGEARAKYCFGSTKGPCSVLTNVLQPIHSIRMCLGCCKCFNDGCCLCEECSGSTNGYICYVTIHYPILYEILRQTKHCLHIVPDSSMDESGTIWRQCYQTLARIPTTALGSRSTSSAL